MILLVLGIIAIEYGLIYLTCSLACGGMEALAAILFFGGLFGLTALTTFILRGIYPDMSKKKRIGTAFIMVAAPILLSLLLSRL